MQFLTDEELLGYGIPEIWLNDVKDVTESGILPEEIGLFVRSENGMERALMAVKKAGLSYQILDDLEKRGL